jgi:putative nucleotidyltransferase with HDIG domain
MNSPTNSFTLERLRDLPALPQVVIDVQSALSREDVSLDEIAQRISHDQALAARTLRLANCSFYGVPGRVVSIRNAIGVLGLRSLSTMLTAAAVSNAFRDVACKDFDLGSFWRHSIAVALCSQDIARTLLVDADVAFTAGLLHDLGRLALASKAPIEMAAVLVRRNEDDCLMLTAEHSILGTDHTVIGARVAGDWHFGAKVVDAIRLHHEPPASPLVTLIDIIHAADSIVHALDVSGDCNEMVPPLDVGAWNRLALTPNQSHAVFRRTESELDELCEVLGV